MDREIDVRFKRRKIIKRIVLILLALVSVTVLLVWGPRLITPSLSRNNIRTAKVFSAPFESSITATGTVVPEFEQVISSPIDARVVKVLRHPGDVLRKGDPILQLDVSATVLAVDKCNQQIELKKNAQAKARLDLESTLNQLQSQIETKSLDYQSLKASSARNRQLHQEGLLSVEKLKEVELLEDKAAVELKQLESSRKTAQLSTRTQLEGLDLELHQLEKERDEARRQLELATTKADRDGVLTWVIQDEGATVARGAVAARIADLSSFRVDATLSDVHANKLTPGIPVSVRIGENNLQGAIRIIDPTIKNGIITIQVGLSEKASKLLKSNLRVDVNIVTSRKAKALQVGKGSYVANGDYWDVFVVRGDSVVKTRVRLGLANFDNYEVLEGLIEGDEVVVSDMASYQHLREVKLK